MKKGRALARPFFVWGTELMIVLFTDFGQTGPYIGQMEAALVQRAPGVPIIDLLADAPAFNPRASSYLLAALVFQFPEGTVFLCVVDPGVGMPGREAVVLEADGRWYVGPGNGLFELVGRRADHRRWWRITWRPDALSDSFHGRDLFAPVAARIARGESTGLESIEGDVTGKAWPDDLGEIIYIDAYGNAATGLRGESVAASASVEVGGERLAYRRTFGEVPAGAGFWYINSFGLVEVAVNQGRADERFGIAIGSPVSVSSPVRSS